VGWGGGVRSKHGGKRGWNKEIEKKLVTITYTRSRVSPHIYMEYTGGKGYLCRSCLVVLLRGGWEGGQNSSKLVGLKKRRVRGKKTFFGERCSVLKSRKEEGQKRKK